MYIVFVNTVLNVMFKNQHGHRRGNRMLRDIKCRRLSWAGHVASKGEMRGFVKESDGSGPF
jgi:hypothetical protein